MKSAVVPKMHAKKRGKPLANKDPHQNIVTVPFVSLDFLLMWAAMVGDVDKDCLPADNHISEHFKNYKFFLHSLEKKKTKDEIIAGIEKGKDATPGRIRIAPLQVLISLMGREPHLAENNPVVTFWKLNNDEWGHCMYFQEKGCRYKKIEHAHEAYPEGTIIVSVELW